MNKINEIFNYVKFKITNQFPQVNIWLESIEDDYFIMIDDRNVYINKIFETLILNAELEIIWPAGIHNLYFSYEELPLKAEALIQMDTSYKDYNLIIFQNTVERKKRFEVTEKKSSSAEPLSLMPEYGIAA